MTLMQGGARRAALSLVLLMLAQASLPSCYRPYYLASAEAERRAGNYTQALADIDAARMFELDEADVEAVTQTRDAVALLAVQQEIEAARALIANGEALAACLKLRSLEEEGGYGSAAATAALVTAGSELAGMSAQAIEALAARHAFVSASRIASCWARGRPTTDPTVTAARDLARRATAYYLERARAESGTAAFLDARLARTFAEDAPPAHWSLALPQSWAVVVAPAACAALSEALAQHAEASASEWRAALGVDDVAAGVDGAVASAATAPRTAGRVEVLRCEWRAERWSTRESFPFEDYDVEVAPEGTGRLVRTDKHGEREVQHVRYTLQFEALLSFAWDGFLRSESLAYPLTLEDASYWSPNGSSHFSYADDDGARAAAVRTIAAAIDARMLGLRRRGAEELAREAEAMQAEPGEPAPAREAAAAYTAALILADATPRAAEAFASSAYGLDAAEVQRAFKGELDVGGVVVPPAPSLPLRTDAPYAAIEALGPVRNESDKRGLQIFARPGVDLAYALAQSPVSGAPMAASLTAVLRTGPVFFDLGVVSEELGGDLHGARIAILGLVPVFGDDDGDATLLSVGLGYEELHATDGGGYVNVSPAVGLRVPLSVYATAIVEARPNLLMLRQWLASAPDDPEYYSPLRAGFVLHLGQRLYIEANATHYLGKGTKDPVQLGANAGVSL